MSVNLLHHVSDKITSSTISKLASIMELETETIATAVNAALPTLLQGILGRSETTDETSALRGFIQKQNIASNVATDFLNLNRESVKEYLGIGENCLWYLYGDGNNGTMQTIAEKTGMELSTSTLLSKLLAPLAMGHVSKLGNRENLTDAQFSQYLSGQKENLLNPEERKQAETNKNRRRKEVKSEENPIEIPAWIKWLIPALAVLGLVWWLSQKTCSADLGGQDTAEKKEVKNTKATPPSTKNTSSNTQTNETNTKQDGWHVNDDGNLIDANGNLSKKAGEFSVTNGFYVDTNGKSLSPVSNPLDKSTDEFKKNFSNMFMNKQSVGTSYTLSQIEFDKTAHTIKSFSKREVEGLANALRTIPGAKIQVQVHSNDGDDNTKLRAQVVKDMLITLGVDKGQISSKGMGAKEPSKADLDKVEIHVVEIK